MSVIRVLIGDPESSFRFNLRSLLDNVEGFLVVGEASTIEEATSLSEELSPGVLLFGFPLSSAREIKQVKEMRVESGEAR